MNPTNQMTQIKKILKKFFSLSYFLFKKSVRVDDYRPCTRPNCGRTVYRTLDRAVPT